MVTKPDFDWNRARAFLATAEHGSFSAAARALGLAQPTLGRQVAALEEELGVVLFERVGHKLVLTPTGLDLVEHVRAMSEAATHFSLIAAGQAQSLHGLVRIAASEAMSAHLLPPIVGELRISHPGIEIELVVSNAASDLRRREADIAIRNFRPRGEDLVAKLVRESAAYLYAAPSYLERIGNPRTAEELAERGQVLAFDDSDTFKKGLHALGLPFRDESFPVRTENHLVQWELAKAGIGLCMMMEEIGDAEPRVRRALPDAKGFTFPTWVASHRELKTSRRIRVVFDLLTERLAGGRTTRSGRQATPRSAKRQAKPTRQAKRARPRGR
ncbi:MAG: LysR family transcriptional regulator [Sandaracinaceae bacterium]|nr:LysR family transcriptional regulator [Sandaracinaceae bacterium]